MESREGFEALFLYTTEGILVTNEVGEIIKINPSAERLFRYDKNELINQKVEVLIPRDLTQKHIEKRTKYNYNPHARSMGAGMELYGLRKDGSIFPVEVSLSPYANKGKKYVISFIVDITNRKKDEEKLKNYSIELERQVRNRTLILEEAIEELEKTKKDLHKALKKEKELNELKSRFVSMASHEFRTPLTTMMSSLSLIKKYAEFQDISSQNKHVNKIKNSIVNLTDILNDFLSVSKLEDGKIENRPEDLDLNRFIEEVVAEMENMATENQQITYHHSGNNQVFIDSKFLKNILFNLISNAIKFSPENGKIEVKSSVSPSSAVISVSDDGIGISKEDQEHLFERFYRGQNATYIQGTGLGLSIVAKYIELMQGSIDVESTENKGTTVIITIPQ